MSEQREIEAGNPRKKEAMEGRAQCLQHELLSNSLYLKIGPMRKGGSPAQKSSCLDAAEMSWELKPHKLEGLESTISALKPQKGQEQRQVHHFPYIAHMKAYSANAYI